MDKEPVGSTTYELEHDGKKLTVTWDGFCLAIESESQLAFIVSANDPVISANGNAAIVFGGAEEIAMRFLP